MAKKHARKNNKGPLTIKSVLDALQSIPKAERNALFVVGDKNGHSPETVNKLVIIYDNKHKVDEVQVFGSWLWEPEEDYSDSDEDNDVIEGAACTVRDAVMNAIATDAVGEIDDDVMEHEIGPALKYAPTPPEKKSDDPPVQT